MQKYITSNIQGTKKIGAEFASKLTGGEVVCLYGQLGAGKTVFVQGMMEYFSPKKRVLSPTFIIVRHHRLAHEKIKFFFHVDLYRLTDEKEIRELEFREYLNKPDTLVAIEWAEKMEKLLPKKRIDIHIYNVGEEEREINISYVQD